MFAWGASSRQLGSLGVPKLSVGVVGGGGAVGAVVVVYQFLGDNPNPARRLPVLNLIVWFRTYATQIQRRSSVRIPSANKDLT